MKSLFPQSEQLPKISAHWCLSRDGDEYGYEISRRHYSTRRYREQRQRLFCGPGRKLVLLSNDGSALFVWRKFIDACEPPQTGWNCAIFRNESLAISSQLICEAVEFLRFREGHCRCYTLVGHPRTGKCFIAAGWMPCGNSKGGKIILELL